jgi:hypothetical protein
MMLKYIRHCSGTPEFKPHFECGKISILEEITHYQYDESSYYA